MEVIGQGLIPVQREWKQVQSELIETFTGGEAGANALGNSMVRLVQVFAVGAKGLKVAGELINGSFAGILTMASKLPFVSDEFKAFADAYAQESREGIKASLDATQSSLARLTQGVARSPEVWAGSTTAIKANTAALDENDKKTSDLIDKRKAAWQEIQFFQFDLQDREIAKTNKHFQEMLSLFEGNGKAQIEMRKKIEDEWTLQLEEIQAKRQEQADAEAQVLTEKKQAEFNSQLETTKSFADSSAQMMDALFQGRLNNIEAEKRAEIQAIQISTKSEKKKNEEIAKIEKKAQQESLKIRQNQWRMNLIQSVANTALGVTSASTMQPWPVAVAAMASTAAAGAAQTALIAANKPKFANGGIVGGSSMVGDSVDARVNSGEMILNRSQQKQLFDMANGSTNRQQQDHLSTGKRS
jgi:hypothetical protein